MRLTIGPNVARDKKHDHLSTATNGEGAIHRELATHIRDLLETAVIPDEDHPGETRALRPDDVASADRGQTAKVRSSATPSWPWPSPAVIARGDNVLESEASTHFHRLLAAVARPADVRRARAAGLSWFFGWDAGRVAAATDAELSAVQVQLHSWGETLSGRGRRPRLLARSGPRHRWLPVCWRSPDGDRAMTDLDHIAELLSLSGGRQASPTTLLTTFEALSGGSDDGNVETDLAARRVESESRAVQIMTTFVAKGLEYPDRVLHLAVAPQGGKGPRTTSGGTRPRRNAPSTWPPMTSGVLTTSGAERELLAAQEAVGSPSAGALRGPHPRSSPHLPVVAAHQGRLEDGPGPGPVRP